MILAIETSGEVGSVAWLGAGGATAEREFATRQEACRVLPVVARDLLTEAGIPLGALRAVGVSRGPGAFNGLRVGMAFGKAIAHAQRVPAVGIATSLAWAAETAVRRSEVVLAVLQPVRRGFLYLTVFAPGETPQGLAPTEIQSEESWRQRLAELAAERPVTLTGDWPGLASVTEMPAAWRVDEDRVRSPRATTIGRLAIPHLATTKQETCFTLRPEYISPSQAERVKGVNLGL